MCAEVQQDLRRVMLPQGEIRRGRRPSVSRRQSQRPSTARPNPTGTLNPVTLSAKTIICIRDVWVFKCVYILSVGDSVLKL